MGDEEDDDAGISTPVSFILPATAAASDLIQDAIDEYDAKLIRFTHFFEQSHAGRLLADVVYDLSVYPSANAIPGTSATTGVITSQLHSVVVPLEGFPTASPQQGSAVLTAFISLLCFSAAIPFTYFGAYGNLREYSVYSLASFSGYFAISLSLSVLQGLVPELLQCLLCLLIGGGVGYWALSASSKQLSFVATFAACLLASHLIYSLWGGIPVADISPAFSGPAGLIFNTGFVGDAFYFLRVLYYLFLLAIGGLLYFSLPPYIKGKEPTTTEERDRARNWEHRLMGFIFGWIVAGVASQMIFLFGAASSPLDPLSSFFIPCQLQWNRWETFVSLGVWALLAFTFARIRTQNETDIRLESHMLPAAVVEQWKLMGSE